MPEVGPFGQHPDWTEREIMRLAYRRAGVASHWVILTPALRRWRDREKERAGRAISLYRAERAKRPTVQVDAQPDEFGQWTFEYRHGFAAGYAGAMGHPFPNLPDINELKALGKYRRAAWSQGYRAGWRLGELRDRIEARA